MGFRFNPLTSKFDLVDTGGGPPGDEVTITTADGDFVTGTQFFLEGQSAGIVQVMDTNTDSGDTLVENRAWETQYIVDPNATVGQRGTFQTIQAALNQAVADGMGLNTPRKIIIRARAITENLTIPTGAILEGACYSFPAGGVFTPIQPAITGNHTFADNAIISLNNLSFVAAATNVDLFQCATGGGFYTKDCNFAVASGVGMFINVLAGNAFVSASDCTFIGLDGEYGIAVSSSGSKVVLRNCDFPGNAKVTVDESVIFLYSCTNIGGCASTNAGELHAFNTQFAKNSASGLPHITGNFNVVNLSKCSFQGTTDYCISNSPADIYFDSCTILSDGAISAIPRFCEAGANVHMNADTQGNILVTALTAANYQVTGLNHYIGVTSTAAPRTITLPLIADCFVDQVFIIKDESLAAATNNITVDGNGALIDGAANYVINTNGGYVALKFNGTAFFIINNVSAGGGGGGGDVVGPASSTDLNLAIFDGLTGKLLQDTGISSVTPVFTGTVTTGGNLVMADTNLAGTEGVLTNTNGDRLAFAGPPATANFCFGNAGNFALAGIANTLVGQAAGNGLTTGVQNCSFGNAAMLSAQGSTGNSVYGYAALQDLVVGDLNTAVGYGAMLTSNNCSNCTAVGTEALNALTVGQANVAVGTQAGNAVDGAENTLIGAYCGNASSPQTVGDRNTALGNSALQSGCGDRNLVLGFGAGSLWSSDTESSNILLSNGGVSGENNTLRIGTQGTSPGQINRSFIAGISGVAVASSLPVVIDSNGQLGTLAIGEQIRSFLAQASAVTLTNNTAQDVTSISLTPGTWDISCLGGFQATTAVTGTRSAISINSVSATRGTIGDNECSMPLVGVMGIGDLNLSIPQYRVVVASTTTFYLVAYASFSAGTYKSYGRISAVRVG